MAKQMTKDDAVREARLGALMHGGTFYVVRRADRYKALPAYLYEARRHGRVAEMFDADKVRRTLPPEPKPLTAELLDQAHAYALTNAERYGRDGARALGLKPHRAAKH